MGFIIMSLGVHVDVGALIQACKIFKADVTKNADKTPPRTRLHK